MKEFNCHAFCYCSTYMYLYSFLFLVIGSCCIFILHWLLHWCSSLWRYSLLLWSCDIVSCDAFFAVLSDPIGRKSSIIVGGVVFFVGGALQAASYYLWWGVWPYFSLFLPPFLSLSLSSSSLSPFSFSSFLALLFSRMVLAGRMVAGIGVG